MIVLTAPTGQIGSQVLDRLADRDDVRVVTRDPARLPESARDHVEVVEGSHGDADVLREAFHGADAVFWLVPPDPRAASVHDAYVGFTEPAARALVDQGVGRVVSVSALGRGTPQAAHAGYVTGSLAADDLLASTGVALRALVMPSFMDNVLRQVPVIRDHGLLTSPIPGDVSLPTCATRDIAAKAAALLVDPSWDGVDEVPVLGPEDLSFEDLAATVADVLGQPVRFQQADPDEFVARMTGLGMSEAMARGNLDMALAKADGLDSRVQRTDETSSPTTFRQWCTDTLRPAVAVTAGADR